MRVIVDTNVLISGIFFGGPPAKILQAWHGGELKLVVSPEILEEYFEVCARISVRYPDIDIAPILVLIALNSQVVESPTLAERISRDEDDDKFIACAIASGTRTIISGDNDLLTASGYKNVQVVRPRDFVDRRIFWGSPDGVVQGHYGLSGTASVPASMRLGGQGARAGNLGVHRARRTSKEPGGTGWWS